MADKDKKRKRSIKTKKIDTRKPDDSTKETKKLKRRVRHLEGKVEGLLVVNAEQLRRLVELDLLRSRVKELTKEHKKEIEELVEFATQT